MVLRQPLRVVGIAGVGWERGRRLRRGQHPALDRDSRRRRGDGSAGRRHELCGRVPTVERIIRPVVARALAGGPPPRTVAPGIAARLTMTWLLVARSAAGRRCRYRAGRPGRGRGRAAGGRRLDAVAWADRPGGRAARRRPGRALRRRPGPGRAGRWAASRRRPRFARAGRRCERDRPARGGLQPHGLRSRRARAPARPLRPPRRPRRGARRLDELHSAASCARSRCSSSTLSAPRPSPRAGRRPRVVLLLNDFFGSWSRSSNPTTVGSTSSRRRGAVHLRRADPGGRIQPAMRSRRRASFRAGCSPSVRSCRRASASRPGPR